MTESKQVQKLKAELDTLQTRIGELETEAVAMREALQASEHFEALMRGAEHALSNRDPQVAAAYHAEAERARDEALRLRQAALASDIGRKQFERLLRLEQECKELKTLVAAIAKQSGGTVRITKQTMIELSPDVDVDVSSSDFMHTETIIRLLE